MRCLWENLRIWFMLYGNISGFFLDLEEVNRCEKFHDLTVAWLLGIGQFLRPRIPRKTKNGGKLFSASRSEEAMGFSVRPKVVDASWARKTRDEALAFTCTIDSCTTFLHTQIG